MYSRFLILLHRHAASRSQVASHLLVYPRRNGRRERLMQRCFSRRHARPGPAARWMDGLAAQKNRLTPGSSKGEVALRKLGVCISVAGRQNGIISAYHHIDSSVKQVAFVALVGTTGSGGEFRGEAAPRVPLDPIMKGGVFDMTTCRAFGASPRCGAEVPCRTAERYVIASSAMATRRMVLAIGQACRDANVWELVPCSPSVSIPIDSQEGLTLGWSLEHGTRNPDPLDSIFSSDHEASKSQAGRSRAWAMTRAVLRNPRISQVSPTHAKEEFCKILCPSRLFNEATSTLGPQSEAVVQQALAAAAVGQTTVALAHANRIHVFGNGWAVE